MKTSLLVSLVALTTFAAQAQAERVSIQIGQNFTGRDRILLRQELAREGYRSEEYRLRSVTVFAEGRGQLSLVVGSEIQDQKRLQNDGTPVRNEGYRVTLNSNIRRPNSGPWQIHFGNQANMRVRRIVVDMDYLGDGGRPRPPRENIYSVRLESFGGVLNGAWEAPRGERIVEMRLLRQHSNDSCVEGRSYFASSYRAEVSRGCRGTFEIVTVFDRY